MTMKISARVEIDATPAQRGSADASKAVQSIGTAAEQTAAQLAKLNKVAGEGLRGSMSVVGGTNVTGAQDTAAAALDRLKAKYDPVIAAQQKYKARVTEIAQAQAAGAVTASQAIDLRLREKASFDSLISSMNNAAAARKAAAEAAVSRVSITPDRGADIAAYGAELDKLRMRYNPLYAVIAQYKAAQEGARQANAAGAIDADELTAALSRQRQAALASIDAIKGRNRAISDAPNGNNQRFQASNLAFQVQDTITTAPFMPWYTVALQQGPQVAAVMDSLEDKSAGLRTAFMSLISPWSLISVAAVGATAFAIQYFTSAEKGTKTADEAIKQHSEIIKAVKQAYGEAAQGLTDYVQQSRIEMESAARQSLTSLQKVAKDTNSEFFNSIGVIRQFVRGGGDLAVDKQFMPFQQAILDLRKSVREGNPDFASFRAEVVRITATNPGGLRKLGDELITSSSAAADAQRRLVAAGGAIDVIGGKALGQINGIQELTKALRELAGIAVPALTDAENAQRLYQTAISRAGGREDKDDAYKAYQDALVRIDNQNPTVINSDGNRTNVPTPGAKPITLGDRDKAAERSASSASNAYRDLVKSADDRIAQMKLEAQLAGQTGIASDTLRFKLDLLQQSEDKGRSLSGAQVEAINKRVEAFKKYAEEAAKATLKADLLFEREQLGRSSFDQQIASGLRGAGLEIDFDSYEAGLIRTNLQLQYARDLAGDFTNTFFSSLDQGKSIWESFGDAGVSALKRISETLMNDVLNSLFSVGSAAGGSSGGGLFGSLLGGLGSLFGGGSKSVSWASSGDFDYDTGGYTGPGGIRQPAGVVHKGEVVWSQRDVSRAGGVATVEAMRLGRRGYDNGGTVDVAPLMSPGQSAAMASSAQRMQLVIKLGLSTDDNGNIIPIIKRVVAEDAPGIAIQVVEDFSANALPDRIAAYNEDPRAR